MWLRTANDPRRCGRRRWHFVEECVRRMECINRHFFFRALTNCPRQLRQQRLGLFLHWWIFALNKQKLIPENRFYRISRYDHFILGKSSLLIAACIMEIKRQSLVINSPERIIVVGFQANILPPIPSFTKRESFWNCWGATAADQAARKKLPRLPANTPLFIVTAGVATLIAFCCRSELRPSENYQCASSDLSF